MYHVYFRTSSRPSCYWVCGVQTENEKEAYNVADAYSEMGFHVKIYLDEAYSDEEGLIYER